MQRQRSYSVVSDVMSDWELITIGPYVHSRYLVNLTLILVNLISVFLLKKQLTFLHDMGLPTEKSVERAFSDSCKNNRRIVEWNARCEYFFKITEPEAASYKNWLII